MNENFRLFFEKVAADPELQAKLSECKSPDEAYALASGIQEGFTKEEFIADIRAGAVKMLVSAGSSALVVIRTLFFGRETAEEPV